MNAETSIRTALILAAIVAAAPFASGPIGSANATEILFTIAGTGGDPDATFELPDAPTPDSFNLGGSFTFTSVPAVVGGVAVHLSNLAFYNSAGLGGLVDSAFYNLTGAQLYSGPESSPIFAPAAYELTSFSGNIDTVTLTAVPEPSTWALMLLGFAGLCCAGLRRWNQTSNRAHLLSAPGRIG